MITTNSNPTSEVVTGSSSINSVDVKLHVNVREHTLNIEPRVTLLDALRKHLELNGSRKGCNHVQYSAYPNILKSVTATTLAPTIAEDNPRNVINKSTRVR